MKLIEANTYYDSKKPAKGQANELGPRRTTLAGGFLLELSRANLATCTASQQQMVGFFDTVAVTVGNPTIEKQHALLVSLVAHYNTPKMLEPEIAACLFFKTKKADKYIRDAKIS